MSDKETITLYSEKQRTRAAQLVYGMEPDSRVTFQGPRRTLDQNAKLHAMLRDIARQHTYFGGERLDEDDWKIIFMHALKGELRVVPSIDGRSLVPIGTSTSKLSVEICTQLIELLYAQGAQWGIEWSEPDLWGHSERKANGSAV